MKVKKYRGKEEYSYTLGVYPTLELLLLKPECVVLIILTQNSLKNRGVKEIKELCEKRNIQVEINDKKVHSLTSKENVYAIGVFKKYSSTLQSNKNHILLVNPSNNGNLGSIVRTMVGFDIANLAIIRPAVDIYNPEVIRSSMGAVFKVNFKYYKSFMEYTAKSGNHIYTFMTDGERVLNEVQFRQPFTLVFGNEAAGLPQEFKGSGTSVRIPQSGLIDSLNLSVAVGIILYSFYQSIH